MESLLEVGSEMVGWINRKHLHWLTAAESTLRPPIDQRN